MNMSNTFERCMLRDDGEVWYPWVYAGWFSAWSGGWLAVLAGVSLGAYSGGGARQMLRSIYGPELAIFPTTTASCKLHPKDWTTISSYRKTHILSALFFRAMRIWVTLIEQRKSPFVTGFQPLANS